MYTCTDYVYMHWYYIRTTANKQQSFECVYTPGQVSSSGVSINSESLFTMHRGYFNLTVCVCI